MTGTDGGQETTSLTKAFQHHEVIEIDDSSFTTASVAAAAPIRSKEVI
jgi:hypothetical protein